MPEAENHSPQSRDSARFNAETFDAEVYVQQTLKLMGLGISPHQLPGIVENFDRIQAIAQPVLNFPLPDDLEAAPQFEP